MIGCTGPPTPEKFRMYRNLVAAPAFLIMLGPSATVFLYTIFVIQRSATCTRPAWTLDARLDASLDFRCQLDASLAKCANLDRRVLNLDSTTSTE
jgi:hypothetical protein